MSGVVVFVFGSVMLLFSIAACLLPGGVRVNMPVVISIFALFMLLGLVLIWRSVKYRLLISELSVRQVDLWTDHKLEWAAVTEVDWRCRPRGGSVRLTESFGSLRVELDNFAPADRDAVVALVRSLAPDSKQTGWNEFARHFEPSPESERRSINSRRLFLCLFAAHAVAFGYLWAIGFGLPFLIASGLNASAALYVATSHKP